MIHVNSWREGIKLWSIVYEYVNEKMFDSFGELNEAILRAVQEFKERQQQQQQQQQQTFAGSKRGRSSPLEEVFAKKACIR